MPPDFLFYVTCGLWRTHNERGVVSFFFKIVSLALPAADASDKWRHERGPSKFILLARRSDGRSPESPAMFIYHKAGRTVVIYRIDKNERCRNGNGGHLLFAGNFPSSVSRKRKPRLKTVCPLSSWQKGSFMLEWVAFCYWAYVQCREISHVRILNLMHKWERHVYNTYTVCHIVLLNIICLVCSFVRIWVPQKTWKVPVRRGRRFVEYPDTILCYLLHVLNGGRREYCAY